MIETDITVLEKEVDYIITESIRQRMDERRQEKLIPLLKDTDILYWKKHTKIL